MFLGAPAAPLSLVVRRKILGAIVRYFIQWISFCIALTAFGSSIVLGEPEHRVTAIDDYHPERFISLSCTNGRIAVVFEWARPVGDAGTKRSHYITAGDLGYADISLVVLPNGTSTGVVEDERARSFINLMLRNMQVVRYFDVDVSLQNRDDESARSTYSVKQFKELVELVANECGWVPEKPDNIPEGRPWIFRLTKGSGVSVCRAYLDRLNQGKQAGFPFCDRPESGEEYGFIPLSRVPLSDQQMRELGNRAHSFMSSRDQDSVEKANVHSLRLGLKPTEWMTDRTIARYVGTDIFVWRYDPLVDIDNDGVLDQIVVWRGYPVGSHLPGCGRGDKWNWIMSDTQMPFFVDAALTRIDEDKTMRVFGHPLGGYKISKEGEESRYSDKFRPIGLTIGIFNYEGTHYFDTFFDSWGDIEGDRRADPAIRSTLGVFLHKDGKTRQICEYYWINNPNEMRIRNTKW